jgi:TonB family protein
MEGNQANNILNFIEQQERRARRKRTRIVLAITGGVVIVVGAIVGVVWVQGSGTGLRTFQANQLTRSQVTTLFEQDRSPLLVRYGDTDRVDTIRSVEEYTLYLAARTVEVNPNRVENEVPADYEPPQSGEISGPLASADIMPAFPGGEAALYRFLSNQIRYPEEALRNKIEGKVYIRFVVQADGSITDLEVLRGIGYGCDKEALRVVQMMPRWVPGELGGRAVPVYSSLAVEFKFL